MGIVLENPRLRVHEKYNKTCIKTQFLDRDHNINLIKI